MPKKELKVLGIAGSPRRGGNTDLLLAEVMKGAASKGAKVKTIVLDDLEITPCQHCDNCLDKGKCWMQDDMQMVYRELNEADRIVLASPLYFLGVTAQTKTMIDRCQALWARKYKLKMPPLSDNRERKGLFISVGARSEDDMFAPAISTVRLLFTILNIAYEGELVFSGVDEKGAIAKHPNAMQRAFKAGERLAEA